VSDFKYCYVSDDQFGLKKGQWYTAKELSEACGLGERLIIDRVYSASYISGNCNIVRDEQLAVRSRNKKRMFTGYALERYSDFLSSQWLRRAI
jgi:hypothetical protein